jgi:glutamyl-tRNA synthetase
MKLEEDIRFFALSNAIKYKGEARAKAVLGQVMAKHPKYREKRNELVPLVDKIIQAINALSTIEQEKQFASYSQEKKPTSKTQERQLPELKNLDKETQVVMRLAPYPSGPLHIGNARMVVLNDEYVKRYNGKLILVFDDTIGGGGKKIYSPAYDMIPENLAWLDVKTHDVVYKSDRLPLYYEYTKKLLEQEQAYACLCEGTTFREEFKVPGKPCPHRDQDRAKNLELWEQMLAGEFQGGDIVIRLKTGMDQPNPALRDHVIMRINETPHPRIGDKYSVWPLLEFNWAIDDHLLGVTHILRGKDLVKEDQIEEIVWKMLNWPRREFIHYGRMRIENFAISKSKALNKIEEGEFSSWDDPRTWSLNSLAKRGIQPKAVRKAILDLGVSLVDINFSPKTIYAYNRMLLDEKTPRAFFIHNPITMTIKAVPQSELQAEIPKHPSTDLGIRKISLPVVEKETRVLLNNSDLEPLKKGHILRLKDLCNISFESMDKNTATSVFHSFSLQEARDTKAKIVHWLPSDGNIPLEIQYPDGSKVTGDGEYTLQDYTFPQFIQLERFGFINLTNKKPMKGSFAHK